MKNSLLKALKVVALMPFFASCHQTNYEQITSQRQVDMLRKNGFEVQITGESVTSICSGAYLMYGLSRKNKSNDSVLYLHGWHKGTGADIENNELPRSRDCGVSFCPAIATSAALDVSLCTLCLVA